MDARIGQRFGRRLPAERNVFQLAGEFALDFDRRPQQHPVGYAGHSGKSPHAALAALDCLPNGLAAAADRRDHADAGDDNRLVL